MPLARFKCSKCGADAPRKYLRHGMLAERMQWLRHHYAKHHKKAFRSWYK